MTILKSDRDLAKELLINWGRWARDHGVWLSYKRPISNIMYRPSRVADAPSMPSVDERHAKIADAAVCQIMRREWPHDRPPPTLYTVHGLIIDRWMMGMDQDSLAKKMKCHRNTVRNRELRAIEEFWNEYSNIVRFLKKDLRACA